MGLFTLIINKLTSLKVNDKIEEFHKLLAKSKNKEKYVLDNALKYYKYYSIDCASSENDENFQFAIRIYKNYFYRKYHIYKSELNLSIIHTKDIDNYKNKITLIK